MFGWQNTRPLKVILWSNPSKCDFYQLAQNTRCSIGKNQIHWLYFWIYVCLPLLICSKVCISSKKLLYCHIWNGTASIIAMAILLAQHLSPYYMEITFWMWLLKVVKIRQTSWLFGIFPHQSSPSPCVLWSLFIVIIRDY